MIKQDDIIEFKEKLEEIKKNKKFHVECEKCHGTGTSFQKRGTGSNTFKKCGTCNGTGTLSKEDYNAKSKMWGRSLWKSKSLPYQLSVTDFSNYK